MIHATDRARQTRDHALSRASRMVIGDMVKPASTAQSLAVRTFLVTSSRDEPSWKLHLAIRSNYFSLRFDMLRNQLLFRCPVPLRATHTRPRTRRPPRPSSCHPVWPPSAAVRHVHVRCRPCAPRVDHGLPGAGRACPAAYQRRHQDVWGRRHRRHAAAWRLRSAWCAA